MGIYAHSNRLKRGNVCANSDITSLFNFIVVLLPFRDNGLFSLFALIQFF